MHHRYNDLFLETTVLTPPRAHQKSTFSKYDASKKGTMHKRHKTLNFSYAVTTTCMSLLQVMNHQANSSTPQRLKPPLLILRSQLPWHSPPALWNEKACPIILTASRALRCSLWNQTVREKHGCAWPNPTWSSNQQAWIAQWSSWAEPFGKWHYN
jgi:hypothetical protein